MVKCPKSFKLYNENMGGADHHDHLWKNVLLLQKTQKWWHRLFYFFVDLAAVNAYILECESRPHAQQCPQKQFHLELGSSHLALYTACKHSGRPGLLPPVARLCDRHFPDDYSTKQECVVCKKARERKQTVYGCDTGRDSAGHWISLCPVPCMRVYHTHQDFQLLYC